jgi:hypothetical protein
MALAFQLDVVWLGSAIAVYEYTSESPRQQHGGQDLSRMAWQPEVLVHSLTH